MKRKSKRADSFDKENQKILNYKHLMKDEKGLISEMKKQKIHDYAAIIMMIEDFDNICNIFEEELSNYDAVIAEHFNDKVFLNNYRQKKIDYTNSLIEYFSKTYSYSVDLLRGLLQSIDNFYQLKHS